MSSPSTPTERRSVITHFNKAHKGRLARALATSMSEPDDAAAVAAVAAGPGCGSNGTAIS